MRILDIVRFSTSVRSIFFRLRVGMFVFVLGALVALFTPGVYAQPGGDPLVPNDPIIVTIDSGATVNRTFDLVSGDGFELRLSPLGAFSYTAVIVDPVGQVNPLQPTDASGNVVHRVDSVALGGTYNLVLQSGEPGGSLLALLLVVPGSGSGPTTLTEGESTLAVSEAQSFDVPALGESRILSLSTTNVTPSGALQALPTVTLVDPLTGEVILMLVGGVLPELSIALPPDRPFTLNVEPDPNAETVTLVAAVTLVADSGVSGQTNQPPGQGGQPPGQGKKDATPTLTATATAVPTETAVPTCTATFSDVVNVRSGPGLAFEPPLGQILPGTTLNVTGRNAAATWVQIDFSGVPGWVSTQVAAVNLAGDCSVLPIVEVAAPGTPVATTTPTATAISSPTATLNTGVTPTATQTAVILPTVTRTPTFTATATLVPPTPTFTPSYTPTTPPGAQVAPPDARFNNPLNIPLDNTASVLDFVSYPGGDQEDRVRWDITGMNSNSALSGGRARLQISVSCFGTGTQNIQFFTGGQTFACGQTLVDREVTFDSRTGSVVITAVGGENTYVQWVLTGTATRVN